MFENENLQQSKATSSDVPAGGGSVAGAAPDPFRVAMPVMLIEAAADSLAKLDPWIREHQLAELRSFGDARAQTLGATGLSIDFIAGYELALQVARLYVATTPNLATIHIAPAPGGGDFEAAMERERESSKKYFSDLLDSIGPKLIAFARQVKQETAPLDQVTHEQLLAKCEATATRIAEQSKNDVIVGVNMLLKPIHEWFQGKKDTPPPALAADAIPAAPASLLAGDRVPAGVIKQGSRVKVWTDAAKKTFIVGTVELVHGAGHSFDVELESGALVYVQAGNLALDELAQ